MRNGWVSQPIQAFADVPAKNSLFGKGDAELETIQAMIVLASWGDSGDTRWRPAGHAFRLAMELSLYRCLPHLVATGMGEGKARIELEAERPLVVGARVWLAICKMEYENSFNHGRPVLISEDTSISLGRRFLKHPLSMRMDSRVVAACEILTNRRKSFVALLSLTVDRRHLSFAGPPRITVSEAVAEVRKDNSLFEQWFGDWNLYYDHLNIPQGHFLRDILVTGKNHAVLITNARLLYGVRGQRDIAQISPDQREALSRAVQAASQLVHIAITSPGVSSSLSQPTDMPVQGPLYVCQQRNPRFHGLCGAYADPLCDTRPRGHQPAKYGPRNRRIGGHAQTRTLQ